MMSKLIKVIYIVGDGRSGSTLLESIINNSDEVISVGECFRFWERYYKNETQCGCNYKIQECDLWSKVNQHLSKKIEGYSPEKIKKMINTSLFFKNFKNIERMSVKLIPIALEFYRSIAEISGKSIIVDSSKSPSWAKLLCLIPELDVRIIHLERALPHVASSWKKKILLPEFMEKQVFMPVKSNAAILRTWVRVKLLSSKLNVHNYLFVKYEDVTRKTESTLSRVFEFSGIDFIESSQFYYKPNHSIAGNPMRISRNHQLFISHQIKDKPTNLNWFEYLFFKVVYKLINLIVR